MVVASVLTSRVYVHLLCMHHADLCNDPFGYNFLFFFSPTRRVMFILLLPDSSPHPDAQRHHDDARGGGLVFSSRVMREGGYFCSLPSVWS